MAPRANYPEDWQLQCGELKQRGAHLLKSGIWSDCSFSFDQGNVVLKAHKLILAMASPVFEAMFYGPIAEGNNPIPIPDIQPETFQELLTYIYTDNIELDSFDKACNLYYGAQKYMLRHLLTVCTMYLSCNLTPELACQMYEFSLLVGEEALTKECETVIISETSSILMLKSFQDTSIEIVEKIFAMNNLNISSELDLLKAAERYAKSLNSNKTYVHGGGYMEIDDTTPKKNELDNSTTTTEINNQILNNVSMEIKDPHDTDTINDEHNGIDTVNTGTVNVDEADCKKEIPEHNYCLPLSSKHQEQEIGIQGKPQIKKLLQNIRFLTLTPYELAKEYPTLSTLLTDSEILALLMNSSTENSVIPMPEGFSLSKQKRKEDIKNYSLRGRTLILTSKT